MQLPEVERRVDWPELVSMVRTAEAVGFDSLWMGDHLLYDLPGGVTRGPWVSRFEEAFTIIRDLLRDGRADFDGAFYRVEETAAQVGRAR